MGAADVWAVATNGAIEPVKHALQKGVRFVWRAGRNLACALPGGANLLFPPEALASRFGRGDAKYALQVYRHHRNQLTQAGFKGAAAILEAGPGRNLGTALLWWSRAVAEERPNPVVTLWDVHANAHPEIPGYWQTLAGSILEELETDHGDIVDLSQRLVLSEVASGQRTPNITYLVCALAHLRTAVPMNSFDLIYSQASLEHVWKIGELWPLLARLTAVDGWHSHRIDLADHGRREINYIEMLEWSELGYWLTMRFIPGAINRWRACHHLAILSNLGIKILIQQRRLADSLPIPLQYVSSAFRRLDENELRTTALDVVAIRESC
jgi:hypothetical protein